MRVAFIVSGFPTLSETFILNQITGLLDLGHDVEIFADETSNEATHPDIKKYCLLKRVNYFGVPKNKIKRLFKAIYLILTNFHKGPLIILMSLNVIKYKKEALSLRLLYRVIPFLGKDFDIIHCHFGPNGITGVIVKELVIRAKVVTTFYGYDLSKHLKIHGDDAYKFLFSKGDLFLPVSNYQKRKLVDLGCDSTKVEVHRMGVDVSRFKPLQKEKIAKKIKLLTVGRLVEKKGVEYGIRAFTKVVRKYPNVEYNIIGDGPLRRRLEKIIISLNCEDKINLLGAKTQDEVIKIMQSSDILIAPSVTSNDGDQEGIPVVIMEAMAIGLPLISTFHSGIPELVCDKRSGFLVPEKDVNALADRLDYLIEHPEIWLEMGRCGRKFVEKHYNIKRLNQRLEKIYSN